MNLEQREIDIKHILEKVDLGMAKIAPLVTKHLIEEFEQTGISPVFSKNGKITGLKMIKPMIETDLIFKADWENLENGIKNYNYSLDDFWFLEYEQTEPKIGTTYPILGLFLVVHKKSGKLKEYNVGNHSAFLDDLIQDIKNNFFQA